jgi:hypothetical protein
MTANAAEQAIFQTAEALNECVASLGRSINHLQEQHDRLLRLVAALCEGMLKMAEMLDARQLPNAGTMAAGEAAD